MNTQEPNTPTCATPEQRTSQTTPTIGQAPGLPTQQNGQPAFECPSGRREGVVSNPDPESIR